MSLNPNEVYERLGDLLDKDLASAVRAEADRTGLDPLVIIRQGVRSHLARQRPKNAVYLSAPVNALADGLYEQATTIEEVKKHGDFGLGTFNELDGEMMVLDGQVHQLRADGLAYPVDDQALTPFACVTFFRPDAVDEIDRVMDTDEFFELLTDRLIPSPNMLYAIRVDGDFEYIKARSVPRQQNYLPLAEAAKSQSVFEYHNEQGVLAGFFTPEYMSSINVPGIHLHFMDHARARGGHLMEVRVKKARIGLQHVPQLNLGLPVTLDFLTADLSRDPKDDLAKVER